MAGYACRITRENFQAIASEKPDFDLTEITDWLQVHKSGYFVRDPASIFDCKYLHDDVFFAMYIFPDNDLDQLYRRVVKI